MCFFPIFVRDDLSLFYFNIFFDRPLTTFAVCSGELSHVLEGCTLYVLRRSAPRRFLYRRSVVEHKRIGGRYRISRGDLYRARVSRR